MNTDTKIISDGETLVDSAYRRLRSDIIDGTRPAGERLRIEKLKGIYGIGPTPLREALQKLAQDGLVMTEGNRGFTVSPVDPAEFQDLNLARTVVEREALRLSIANGGNDWESRLVAASYIMTKEDAALANAQGPVPDSWERANSEFHLSLVSACGSDWLLRVRAGLHVHCERFRRASVHLQSGSRNLGEEHSEIARAALDRDADRACDLTERHFARTAAVLAEETEIRTHRRKP